MPTAPLNYMDDLAKTTFLIIIIIHLEKPTSFLIARYLNKNMNGVEMSVDERDTLLQSDLLNQSMLESMLTNIPC